MQHSIVAKLREHLEDGIDTEPEVVYLLCEIRKLLDYHNVGASPLRMFCNWAVHVDLHKPGTVQHLVLRIDEVLTNFFEHPETGTTMSVEGALIKELAYFDMFRAELLRFLQDAALPTDLCTADRQWANFLFAYTGVIEDGSLVANLNWVKKVTFRIDERVPLDDCHLPFTMIWAVELAKPYKGFPKIEISVSGTESRKMIGWGYSLTN